MTQSSLSAPHQFSRNNRLCLEKEIATLRSLGNKIRVWPFMIYHRPRQGVRQLAEPLAELLTEPRLAVTLTKKTGPAVRRNYVRRRVREFFRNHKQEFKGFDYLFFSAINLEKISAVEWIKIFEEVKKKLGTS